MSANDLDTERFEAIEAFLLDRMSAEERSAFAAAIANDADLRKEVEVQRDSMRALELGAFIRVVREVCVDNGEHRSNTGGWSRTLKYAAVVALCLGAALWWLERPSLDQRLYAEYHVEDPGLPVPMSISSNPVFHDAMVAYKMGDYEEACTKWAPLLHLRPSNDTLRYYTASALLEMDSTEQAISLFQGVANDTASQFNRKAQWYLFLAYLRTGQRDMLGTLNLDQDPTYGERMRAIKAELGM